MPTKRLEGGEWPHPSRLPLAAGWEGLCTATPDSERTPDAAELRDHCNLGYARCARLPQQRDADAVRFSVANSSEARIVLRYVCETGHRPGEHGTMEFDVQTAQWVAGHADSRILRMAECYVAVHLERRRTT